MIDPANVWLRARVPLAIGAVLAASLAGCAVEEPAVAPPPTVQAPAIAPEQAQAERKAEQAKLAVEARALLAQAETDVQRARAKRALWLKAWQDLLVARQAVAKNDYPVAIARAKSASELAQLGLEQLAYPAVK